MNREIDLGGKRTAVPPIAVGCMRISDMTEEKLGSLIHTAMDMGLNHFDHADIYALERISI